MLDATKNLEELHVVSSVFIPLKAWQARGQKILCYKPEGRRFKTRCGNIYFIYLNLPHSLPGYRTVRMHIEHHSVK
jgi:hypothetical protein